GRPARTGPATWPRWRSTLAVAPDLEPTAADGCAGEGVADVVGDRGLHVDQREGVVDLDRAHDAARHAGLVGDRPDEVARADPGPPPTAHAQPDPRPPRTGPVGARTGRPASAAGDRTEPPGSGRRLAGTRTSRRRP